MGWLQLGEQQHDSLKSHSYYQSQDPRLGRPSSETPHFLTTFQFIPWLFHIQSIINDSSSLEPKTASLIAPGSPSHPATLISFFDEVPASLRSSLQNVVNKHFIQGNLEHNTGASAPSLAHVVHQGAHSDHKAFAVLAQSAKIQPMSP